MDAIIDNESLYETFQVRQLQIDLNSVGMHKPIINVGTSEEVIDFGDIYTPGYVFFKNMSSNDNITIGPESGGNMVPIINLNPGEVACMRLDPSVVLRAKSDTYESQLLMMLLED